MSEQDKKKWTDLSVKEKVQYALAIAFATASMVIGFASFIILFEIPTSVIGISGLWASASLSILGISLYFRNQMVQFKATWEDRLEKLSNGQA